MSSKFYYIHALFDTGSQAIQSLRRKSWQMPRAADSQTQVRQQLHCMNIACWAAVDDRAMLTCLNRASQLRPATRDGFSSWRLALFYFVLQGDPFGDDWANGPDTRHSNFALVHFRARAMLCWLNSCWLQHLLLFRQLYQRK